MAQQAYNHVYDYTYAQGTAVPEYKPRPAARPAPAPTPSLKKVRLTKSQARVLRRKRILQVIAYVSLVFAMIAVAAGSYVKKNNTAEALIAANVRYNNSRQLNNQLKNQLNSVMSGLDIDKIATGKLGLVKVKDSDKYYLGDNTADATKTDRVYEETTAATTAVAEETASQESHTDEEGYSDEGYSDEEYYSEDDYGGEEYYEDEYAQ